MVATLQSGANPQSAIPANPAFAVLRFKTNSVAANADRTALAQLVLVIRRFLSVFDAACDARLPVGSYGFGSGEQCLQTQRLTD
jgi:hypothetical protein